LGKDRLAGAEEVDEKALDSGEELKKHTSGAEARVDSTGHYAGDESPAYRPNEFFRSM
jgi:hypothetical protein